MIPFLDLLDRLVLRAKTPGGKRARAHAAEARADEYERRANGLNPGRRHSRLHRWAKAARARAKRLRKEAGS